MSENTQPEQAGNHPTPEVLRELLDYDPETGFLVWRERGEKWFSSRRMCHVWNGRYAGKRAFMQINRHGYLAGAVFGIGLLAHRVAYAWYHGEWPSQEIDHINRCKTDNRISNLRNANRSENNLNKDPTSSSKSGVKGVYWDRRRNKWRAEFRLNTGKRRHVGHFDTVPEAKAALGKHQAQGER